MSAGKDRIVELRDSSSLAQFREAMNQLSMPLGAQFLNQCAQDAGLRDNKVWSPVLKQNVIFTVTQQIYWIPVTPSFMKISRI